MVQAVPVGMLREPKRDAKASRAGGLSVAGPHPAPTPLY